jgi:hypothetical protein
MSKSTAAHFQTFQTSTIRADDWDAQLDVSTDGWDGWMDGCIVRLITWCFEMTTHVQTNLVSNVYALSLPMLDSYHRLSLPNAPGNHITYLP